MNKFLLLISFLSQLAVVVCAYSSLRVTTSLRLTASLNQRSSYHVDGVVGIRMTMSASSQQQENQGREQHLQQKKKQQQQPVGNNILILDHLNINHEKGRHDWVKAFYFDFLACAIDPRKQENLEKGRKTVWANIGAHQFHLPEGKPDAQVLQGIITLVYPYLDGLLERCHQVKSSLEGSLFKVQVNGKDDDSQLQVTDPWGKRFRLVKGEAVVDGDGRGRQPGGVSEGLAMRDLTLYTKKDANMEGIARFYNHVLGAPTLECTAEKTVVSVGPFQTLTFMSHPALEEEKSTEKLNILHHDLRDDHVEPPPPEGFPTFLSNYGPHVSIYVADLADCYCKANDLNLVYVNPRFKRRAYTLDQAIDDCMFRCLDIVDPARPENGIILQLEHEIRSVVQRDGSMYRSCPFNKIPPECVDRK